MKRFQLEDRASKGTVIEAKIYVERKVLHMNRTATPASVNPATGAARPNWKKELDEAEAKRVDALRLRRRSGGADIE
ncbi:MAG TPA: hypothetical protein VJJ55_02210, partial [Candidatus Paceibacterota bacterium]